MQDGFRISSEDINYAHDSKQTDVEENDIEFYRKRIFQLDNFTNAIYYHWKKLKEKKV